MILRIALIILVFAFSIEAAHAREAEGNNVASTTRVRASSRVRYSFFNFSRASMAQVRDNAARIDSYNYFSAEYRFNPNHAVALRPAFQFGTMGTDSTESHKTTTFVLDDAYINYQTSGFLENVDRDADLRVNWRLYLPTSAESQRYGMITRLRPEVIFEHNFKVIGMRKLSFISRTEPDYYFQSRTTTATDKGEPRGNRWYGYKARGGLEYEFTRNLALQVQYGHEQYWSYTSKANEINESYMSERALVDLGVAYSVGPAFLILGLSQSREVMNERQGFRPFHDRETEYYILNSWRI